MRRWPRPASRRTGWWPLLWRRRGGRPSTRYRTTAPAPRMNWRSAGHRGPAPCVAVKAVVGPRLCRPEHGRHRLPATDTRGRYGGADCAHARPERAPPRPSAGHRVLVTHQGDEPVALPGMRGEDPAGRVHDPGSHTARYVISPLRLKAAVPARSSGTDPRRRHVPRGRPEVDATAGLAEARYRAGQPCRVPRPRGSSAREKGAIWLLSPVRAS